MSYFETQSQFAYKCRGCLSEQGTHMKNMYESGLFEDFEKVTGIQVLISDNISVMLCKTCEDIMMQCKRFKTQCQQSDLVLRQQSKNITTIEKSSDVTKSKTSGDLQEVKENIVTCMIFENKLQISITSSDMESKIYFSCPYTAGVNCQGKYLKKRHLMAHMVNVHDVDKKEFTIDMKYYCPVSTCSYHLQSGKGKSFTERKYLNQHINKIHKTKTFHCSNCDFNTAIKSAYDSHMKTCCITYVCQPCNLSYENRQTLMVHLLRKHPDLHAEFKRQTKDKKKRSCDADIDPKKIKLNQDNDIYNSPKRSLATQTLLPESNIKNDVTLPVWNSKCDNYGTKTDEISTQTVFEDLLSLKSQTSEDDSLFFSETVSLSDIQTQTFPLEFGLSRLDKETVTSETQSPDLSIKETQTCYCLYDSPKLNFKLFDSVSSSPSSINLTSTETQTADVRQNIKSDVLLSFSSTETQTCFESLRSNNF